MLGFDELGTEITAHLVGPDDSREEFSGETSEFEEMTTGRYSFAVTAQGHQVAQTFVQLQAGQRTMLTVRIKPMQEGQMDSAGATGFFGTWDSDRDQALNMQEFEEGFFGVFSGDDSELTEDEFDQGFESIGLSDEYSYGDFDADGDDAVSEQEFVDGHGADVFDSWDQDGNDALGQQEFESGWFGLVDANGDANVQQDEWLGF